MGKAILWRAAGAKRPADRTRIAASEIGIRRQEKKKKGRKK
jgi:hypothetical protein